MNYFEGERFRDEFGERDVDPELELNSENPFSVYVGTRNKRLVAETVKRMPEDIKSEAYVLGRSVLSIGWVTKEVDEGLENIIIVSPGDKAALRLTSPIIEAPRLGNITNEWVEEQEREFYATLGNDHTRYPFNYEFAKILSTAEEKTGIGSFQILSNHGIIIFSAIAEFISKGKVAAATDNKVFSLFPNKLFPSRLSDQERIKAVAGVNEILDYKPLALF